MVENHLTDPSPKEVCLFTDFSLELGAHPLQRFCLGDTVVETDNTTLPLLAADTESSTAQHDKEIHTVNASVRVVLEAQINVLVDTESKVACTY